MKKATANMASANGSYDGAMVQASMSQVEMTVWLCVMAIMATGMLAILAMVSG